MHQTSVQEKHFYTMEVSLTFGVNMLRSRTYEPKTWLMNPRMGKNVILVRLLANANRKDVAADTGVEKFSYSSKDRERG